MRQRVFSTLPRSEQAASSAAERTGEEAKLVAQVLCRHHARATSPRVLLASPKPSPVRPRPGPGTSLYSLPPHALCQHPGCRFNAPVRMCWEIEGFGWSEMQGRSIMGSQYVLNGDPVPDRERVHNGRTGATAHASNATSPKTAAKDGYEETTGIGDSDRTAQGEQALAQGQVKCIETPVRHQHSGPRANRSV